MIWCIGIGPGDVGYLTQRGKELIEQVDLIAGFDAVIAFIRPLIQSKTKIMTMNYKDQITKLEEVAAGHHAGLKCVVAFMGDPHFSGFQLLERVEEACGGPVETVPGISSAQILASRARICFDETTFITFHRRGDILPFQKHLVHALQDQRNAIVIPRPWDFMPKQIVTFLLANGIPPHHPVEVWEHLTGKEASWRGKLGNCNEDYSDMSIMLIRAMKG